MPRPDSCPDGHTLRYLTDERDGESLAICDNQAPADSHYRRVLLVDMTGSGEAFPLNPPLGAVIEDLAWRYVAALGENSLHRQKLNALVDEVNVLRQLSQRNAADLELAIKMLDESREDSGNDGAEEG